MSGRTYLSIGDVLALLRQEFPDVTISKIRFLESQGLVNPERTPSGYRKFYEHDVERLRWVLRQQREHFLPLKVIKGRLEQEVADYGDDNGHDGVPGTPEPVLVGRATGPAGPRAAGRELPGFEAQRAEAVHRGPDPSRSRAVATAPMVSGRTLSGAGTVADPGPSGPRSPGSPGPTGAGPSSPSSAAPRPGGPAEGTGSGDPRSAAPGAGPRARGAPTPEPTKVPRAAMGSTDLSSHHARGAHAGAGATAPAPPDELTDELVVGALSGATMTIEELAQGSGVDIAAVEELESYGLLCGRVVGGVSYYDEDALTVARVAGGLARYGVEARHLRLHKHAAEREAGFIEQIVLPLLKQRNPEARLRAHEIVTELTQLGQALREVLLRTTLRDQLGR